MDRSRPPTEEAKGRIDAGAQVGGTGPYERQETLQRYEERLAERFGVKVTAHLTGTLGAPNLVAKRRIDEAPTAMNSVTNLRDLSVGVRGRGRQ